MAAVISSCGSAQPNPTRLSLLTLLRTRTAFGFLAHISTTIIYPPIVEAPEPTWTNAKDEVEGLSEADLLAYMEDLWTDTLDGIDFAQQIRVADLSHHPMRELEP